ncbi:JAB domain-containing protein [Vibrio agarivorans]|uniref:JAB domain-containing protein n=1 Tax=Vibrio agarivorans TaxID=153622 RepID=UPI0025B3D078|nr:JAB domain-containing protein [Vibrio agarivorans]MDN3660448.1 JAB domain-containing protein [Vibrio agarivorans]
MVIGHPSVVPEPSQSGKRITTRLCDELTLIDVRTLHHIVVGEQCLSRKVATVSSIET